MSPAADKAPPMRKLISLCLLQLLMLSTAMATDKLGVGQSPPDYLGRDKDGNEVHLSDVAGKVVIVTFWASWCSYCLKELPVLEKIQHLSGKQRMRVIAVNSGEDRHLFLRMANALKSVEVTLTSDPVDKVSKAYGVSSLPHLLMLDPSGKIVAIHHGYDESDLPDLIDEINKLLAEQARSAAAPPPASPPPAVAQ